MAHMIPASSSESATRLEVERHFPLLPRTEGRYSAFPTLGRCGETLLIAARTGRVSAIHGDTGVPRLLAAPAADGSAWREIAVALEPWEEGENNLDAILSLPGNGRVYLVTRRYEYRDNTTLPYLTCWDQAGFEAALRRGRLHGSRRLLHGLMGEEGEIMRPHAAFGHLMRAEKGALLMTVYGTAPKERIPSPWVLASDDNGERWAVRGRIAHSGDFGSYLNECTLAPLGGGRWLAVVRSNREPHPLYVCESDDDGASWSEPRESGLLGHAPMAAWVEGRLLLVYRDLSGPTPAVSLAERTASGWKRLGVVSAYTGGLYDGGYADLMPLGDGRILIAGYLCDSDCRAPRVDGFVVRLP